MKKLEDEKVAFQSQIAEHREALTRSSIAVQRAEDRVGVGFIGIIYHTCVTCLRHQGQRFEDDIVEERRACKEARDQVAAASLTQARTEVEMEVWL